MANTPVQTRKIYIDFLTNFDPHPITGDLAITTNENAVKQSIRNLVMTNHGERKFQPKIGGGVLHLLFENASPQTIKSAQDMIKTTVERDEPRAKLIDVIVSPNYGTNEIGITIVFRLINSEEPIVLDMVLNRVR